MRKFIKILFAALVFCNTTTLEAQCLKGITTNPDNPINTERPDKVNTFFDWRASTYNVNSQYISTPQIESPFNQPNNLLVNHFLNMIWGTMKTVPRKQLLWGMSIWYYIISSQG